MTGSGLKLLPAGRQATVSRWQDKVFADFRLYVVTDLVRKPGTGFLKIIESVYRNGADIVQLRSKVLSMRDKIELGQGIRKIATRMKKLFFVNDSLDLALLTDADGLHVGQDDMAPKEIRAICRKLGKDLYVGLSTHSRIQAKEALKQPVDYFGVGPVFKTPTKPGYQSVGLKLLKQVSRSATKPWVAIGGINESNLGQVLDFGATRIAVVRAVLDARDPGQVSRRLAAQLKANILGEKNV